MMWSDKAFGIWMGHAGEDTQAFPQDEPSVNVAAFEHTQVLAIARRDVTSLEPASRSRGQLANCEPEGIAA
jgi:hypothetical protein